MADVCSSDLAAPLRSRLVRAKLLVEPTDSLKILLAGFYSDRDGSSTTFATMLNGNTVGRSIPGSIILPRQSVPYVVARSEECRVGNERVLVGSSRGSASHLTQKTAPP